MQPDKYEPKKLRDKILEATRNLWRTSKARVIIITSMFLLFIFVIVYFALEVGDPVLQRCSGTLAFTLSFALLATMLVIGYSLWVLWAFHQEQLQQRAQEMSDAMSMSLIWSNLKEENDSEFKQSETEEREERKVSSPRKKLNCNRNKCIHAIFIAAITLTTLILIASLGTNSYYRTNSLPKISGTLKFSGIKSEKGVQVFREDNGMIHIIGENEHDVLFAQGVVTAQERLFQMELQRRALSGRLSELFGNATVATDKLFRTLGLYPAATAAVEYLSAEARSVVTAYMEGVNAYIRSEPPLPVEFLLLGIKPELYTLSDIISITKLMSLSLSMNLFPEIERYKLLLEQQLTPERIEQLWPPYPATAPTIVSASSIHERNWNLDSSATTDQITQENERLKQLQRENKPTRNNNLLNWKDNLTILRKLLPWMNFNPRASNNWVVSGKRTASGKPILANDPHLDLGAPSIWLLVHLEYPGSALIGATFAGSPGIVLGRNDHISWGATNVGADVQDLYIIEEQGDGYWSNGQWKQYTSRTEVIQIAGQDAITLEVKETEYGPIVSEVLPAAGTKPLALRWTSLDSLDTTVEAFNQLQHATNWIQFQQALKLFIGPSQNFIYADKAGNIGYQCPGKIPIRVPGHSGKYPVPSNGSFAWQGFIPFEQLPSEFNPREAFIASANNKVAPPEYNYSILADNDWEIPYRSIRIRQMIEQSGNSITLNDMKRMQFDVYSLLFQDFKRVLQLMQDPFPSPDASKWRDKLLEWDGLATSSSQQATVFEAWYVELSTLAATEVGKPWDHPFYLLPTFLSTTPDKNCGSDVGCSQFAKTALQKAIDRFNGSEIPSWGEVHQVHLSHSVLRTFHQIQFNLRNVVDGTIFDCMFDRTVPYGGDGFTVNVGPYNSETFGMDAGPSYRQLIDWGDIQSSVFVMPMGESGNIYSNYYDNYLQLWAEGDYIPMKTKNYSIKHTLNILKK